MKIRRIIVALLTCTLMVVGITGCGSTNSSNQSQENTTTQEKTDSSTSSEKNSTKNNDTVSERKVLVVYYSASGRTKAVANTIAETAGADVFEIVPTEVYSDADLDWTDDNSRVSKEHDDKSLRDVELTSTTVKNWNSYDTVFIGYPIWWGIAAWPTDTFVKANDFKGKTVIPFCTAASSGIGESGTLLAEEAGTGDWKDGMRFSSDVESSEVAEWVKGLEKEI
ncbi:MAG: flavodoxin [Anaerostipes sp.]|jgi:flavodoxin